MTTISSVKGINGVLEALLVFSIFIGISLAAIFAWHRQKHAWLIAWLIYLVALSPVLGLIQVGSQGAADRYTYFPTLPVYVLISGAIYSVLQSGSWAKKALLALATTITIVLFMLQTMKQIGVWQSELNLWTHVLEIDPDRVLARNNLGIAYKNIGDYENAIVHFELGAEEFAGSNNMLAWRAVTYMHLDQYKEAITDLVGLGETADTRPELIVDTNCIQYNIGWNYAHLRMYQESVDLFTRVAANSNSGPDAHAWLDELNIITPEGGRTVPNKDLPGICENLIPSRQWAGYVKP